MSYEILAPAGNRECFMAAVNAGADAIYIGLNKFSARQGAENFSLSDLDYCLKRARFFGIKVYVAVNTLIKNEELEELYKNIIAAYNLGADAFIVQDLFLGRQIKSIYPQLNLHLSTQAGVCNEEGALLAKEYGFSRVILARETAFEDIKKIAKIIETEVFVQGALCSSFSGHCYMSSFIGGMSGNRGNCKQPCRKKYTYNGKGFESFSGYNLSLSDLCLKDQIKQLRDAGVYSFKIEGRMRSPEYVYSAVNVYNRIFSGKQCGEEFSHMKSSFNRGEYTSGYFYHNTRGIISSKIQGNIGDFVGKINNVKNRKATVKTIRNFSSKDGFKVLRGGLEIGSAKFIKTSGSNAVFGIAGDVCVGDEIRITKDSQYAKFVSDCKRTDNINVNLSFFAGNKAVAVLKYKNFSVETYSDNVFEQAVNSSLSVEEIKNCFTKCEDYPFVPNVYVEHLDNVFVPKSLLNTFRRKCYAKFFDVVTQSKQNMSEGGLKYSINDVLPNINKSKIAVISSDFSFKYNKYNIAVFKPKDYKNDKLFEDFFIQINSDKIEKYLYVPPFASGTDVNILKHRLHGFDGIYSEGYFGIELAKKTGKKLFAGCGFNLFNTIDISEIQKLTDYYTYSKEMSVNEIAGIGGNGFMLVLGDLQVMDLLYCPFSYYCKDCKRGDIYGLTDENGRKYTVRRYKMSDCRFEVFNPYKLIPYENIKGNVLYDFTTFPPDMCEKIFALKNREEYKNIFSDFTYGNLQRGIK